MNSQFVSFGRSITSPADKLEKVNIEQIYKALRSPKTDTMAIIRNLRTIYSVDKRSYNEVKRRLPYIVCAMFNPSFRNTENFAYTEFFIVDIDHIGEKGLKLMNVRENIETDPRVMLTFMSPSQDGLKVLFKLKERCHDPGIYSLFYKAFVRDFSEMYQLGQVVDARTSDVTRACFVSYDEKAFFNPEPQSVDINDYVDLTNPQSLFDQKKRQDEEAKAAQPQRQGLKPDSEKDPDDDIIQQIRERFGFKPRTANKPLAYVPEQLNDIIGEIKAYVESHGIIVEDIVNIQYGKQIHMSLGINLAEVNLFYGRRGYSVVVSPRSGTNMNLNQLCADIINGFFAEMEML